MSFLPELISPSFRKIILPDVRAFIVIANETVWWSDHHIDEWDKIENPETQSHKHA